MKWLRRGRHRLHKHSITVLDIQATYPLSVVIELEHRRLHRKAVNA